MTDKERLEEIKERYSEVTVLEYINDIEIVGVNMKDLVWLIQQVEELEKENEKLKQSVDFWRIEDEENTRLLAENERLKQALEFYANEENYRETELKGIVPPRPIRHRMILSDFGSKARQALEGEK